MIVSEEPGLEYEPLWLDEDGFPSRADADRAEGQRQRLLRISDGLDEASRRFHRESAPQLLGYELQQLGHYVRQGRLDKIARLLGTLRPRHARLLWHALKRSVKPDRGALAGSPDSR